MAIPGCTEGSHTQDKPQIEPPTSRGTIARPNLQNVKTDANVDGHETYSTAFSDIMGVTSSKSTDAIPMVHPQSIAMTQEEQDDVTVPVPIGSVCKRPGCGVTFVSEEISRLGNGEGTVCKYHPAPPLFREGSKGYLCCKRRVLEFEEFLKITGCTTGKHLFVSKERKNAEELVTCRIDHYQTPTQVYVSIYAKQADKNASFIGLEDSKIHIDLVMPSSKRFRHTLDLYGPIDTTASKFTFLGTKIELVLAKADTRSWLLLEKTPHSMEGYNLTFGVGGKTGTVGGKDLVLSEENKSIPVDGSR